MELKNKTISLLSVKIYNLQNFAGVLQKLLFVPGEYN